MGGDVWILCNGDNMLVDCVCWFVSILYNDDNILVHCVCWDVLILYNDDNMLMDCVSDLLVLYCLRMPWSSTVHLISTIKLKFWQQAVCLWSSKELLAWVKRRVWKVYSHIYLYYYKISIWMRRWALLRIFLYITQFSNHLYTMSIFDE